MDTVQYHYVNGVAVGYILNGVYYAYQPQQVHQYQHTQTVDHGRAYAHGFYQSGNAGAASNYDDVVEENEDIAAECYEDAVDITEERIDFKCILCDTTTKYAQDMTRHFQEKHLKRIRVFCGYCKHGFTRLEHIRKHLDKKPHHETCKPVDAQGMVTKIGRATKVM